MERVGQRIPASQNTDLPTEHAIRLCGALSDGIGWRRREQGLQLQLGQALIANRGYQAPATLRAFECALTLANEIGDVALQLPAIYGQWASLYVGGAELGDLAQRFAALAETQPETGPRLVGLRMVALERFHEGRFKDSLALVRKSLDAYDPVAHRDLAHRFGHDPRTGAQNYDLDLGESRRRAQLGQRSAEMDLRPGMIQRHRVVFGEPQRLARRAVVALCATLRRGARWPRCGVEE